MSKIAKTGKTEGVLEMRGTADELTAETIIIMKSLSRQPEAQTGIPAVKHIAAMAQVATDERMTDAYTKTVEKRPGVDLGPCFGNGGERR